MSSRCGESRVAWPRGGEVNASSASLERAQQNLGAVVMGRNMFGGHGPWEEHPWDGWWGEEPPFQVPVFVITHHPREPLEREGGTTFHFVTDGVEAAYERAREAAGEGDVRLGGGADVAQQCLRVGLVEEMELHVVPSCSAPASGFSRVWATPGSSSP